MNAIRLGDPNLFVKGIAEVTIKDPSTGNIIGFDKVASEGSITSSINMGEITGGVGNPLLITIPDTTRITGALTSQAFSLEQRALTSGGQITYNGITPVCEHVTATTATLTVTGNPVKQYGQSANDVLAQCFVREHGAGSYMGTNYGVDMKTKQVANFVAMAGTEYDVFYFVNNASAKVLELSSNFAPSVASLEYKFNVYAKQNGSTGNGTRVGFLYFIVSKAQFGGDVGISANQTTNATTDYAWKALADVDNLPSCEGCAENGSPYAYYVYVPCASSTSSVEALAVIGGGVSVAVGGSAQIPVKYVMPNGETVQPTYSDMTYAVATQSTATVSTNGVVQGASAGNTVVTITLTKADNTVLTTYCQVAVTA